MLVLDPTAMGGGTATGELKAALFASWPEHKLFHLFEAGPNCSGYRHIEDGSPERYAANEFSNRLKSMINAFDPDLILYRPAPRLIDLQSGGGASSRLVAPAEHMRDRFHQAAMRLIANSPVPIATWIVDDWPSALKQDDPKYAAKLENDLKELLERARLRLSISDQMSGAFAERYGVPFEAVANGVDPADWKLATLRNNGNRLSVRYAGSLAENMTLSSVRQVALAVEALAQEGIDIEFQIKTRSLWRKAAAALFEPLKATRFVEEELSISDYRAWLSAADIVLVAYNFDAASKIYTQFSLANKLPECLASGAVLMVVGPPDVATMKVVDQLDCGVRITADDKHGIIDALRRLAHNPQERFQLAKHGQETAFKKMSIIDKRAQFMSLLSGASRSADEASLTGAPREVGAHVDETAVVAHLISERKGPRHVMLDVGAHSGVSASYFHAFGWQIICFEPDPKNRERLSQRFRGKENVIIDARAVSENPVTGAPFFTSNESTGISGLSAFHDTHKKTGKVDVTTVADVIRENNLSHIDFLKIDVEGFDFSVLKGVPWERLSPDVVECEFEDAKTVPLGHNWRDIADFLVDKGYTVYVSEWHPIIRYGIPHDWRRVLKYARETQIPADTWGNLLAFKIDPGNEAVRAAFSALTKRRNAGPSMLTNDKLDNNSIQSAGANQMQNMRSPFYAGPGEWLRVRSPRLFALLKTAKRLTVALSRRLFWIAPAGFLFSAVFVVGLLQGDPVLKFAISGGVVALGLLATVMYLGLWTYHRIRALMAEVASLREAVVAERKKSSEQNAQESNLQYSLEQMIEGYNIALRRRVDDLSQVTERLDQRIGHEVSQVKEIVAEIDQDLSSLESDLDDARTANAENKRQIESLMSRAVEPETAARQDVGAARRDA